MVICVFFVVPRMSAFQFSLNMANPITSDGSSYGREIGEESAFQWFDEAIIYARAGTGGTGSSAVKFGTNRQHLKPIGGNGGNGGEAYHDAFPPSPS